MNASFRLSSPSTKTPPKSAATLWTARLVATLWKLAVKRARSLRRQARNGAAADYVDLMHAPLSPTTSEDSALDLDDDASIMREAALSVVASGVVSLADFEAVTGFRLPKTRDHGATAMKDDDASSVAATDTSDDSCSIADSDASESLVDVEESTPASTPKAKLVPTLSRREATSSTKPTKWVCVGYGRYVKVQE